MDIVWKILIIVVGVGVAVCFKLCKNDQQWKATLVAFVYLIAIILCFTFELYVVPGQWMPVLGILLFVVAPVLIYIVIYKLLTKRKQIISKKRSAARKSLLQQPEPASADQTHTIKPSMPAEPEPEAAVSTPDTPAVAAEPITQQVPESELESTFAAIELIAFEPDVATVDEQAQRASETLEAAPSAPEPTPAPTPEPTPEPTAPSTPDVQTPISTPVAILSYTAVYDKAVRLRDAGHTVAAAHLFAQAAKLEPEPTAPSTPDVQAPAPTPATTLSYTAVYDKAVRLRDAGHTVAAAHLFTQAAELATDDQQTIKAMFEELAAYVRADNLALARNCARSLDQYIDAMNPVTAIKYRSLKQMLEAKNAAK